MTGTLWQRVLRNAKEDASDERSVGEIARLFVRGEITQSQAVAAHRIAEIFGRYERLTGIVRTAKAFSYDLGFKGAAGDDEDPEERAIREGKAKDQFLEVSAELTRIPAAVRWQVEYLCIEDRHVLPVYLDQIRLFLNRLAIFWKITNVKSKATAAPRTGRAEALTAKSHIVTKTEEPARPKANVERIALLKYTRALRPDLQGEELQSAFEMYVALKDKTIHRFKTDRKRIENGKGPAYRPPATEITPTAATTDRPVLSLPGQQEHA